MKCVEGVVSSRGGGTACFETLRNQRQIEITEPRLDRELDRDSRAGDKHDQKPCGAYFSAACLAALLMPALRAHQNISRSPFAYKINQAAMGISAR